MDARNREMGSKTGALKRQNGRRPLLALGLLVLAAGAAAGCSQEPQAPSECPIDRPVIFGAFNWESARFHTAMARFVLETAYDCQTDDLPGSTIPLLTGLNRGDIDVAMEVWMDRATEVWDQGVEAGRVASLGINMPDASQAWYVPRYMVEGDAERGIEASAPDLKSVTDLKAYASLFRDPEIPQKGRFYNCSLGWMCEINNTKKLSVYGLDDAFTNFLPGTGAALAAAIEAHYTRGEPFVAYYWEPTPVTARFDLVALEEPPYDQTTWDAFAAAEEPTVATAYPDTEVHVGVNTKFQERAGSLLEFLAAYSTTKEQVQAVLLHMHQNKDIEDREIALWFLAQYPEAWRAWMPATRVARIEAALALQ